MQGKVVVLRLIIVDYAAVFFLYLIKNTIFCCAPALLEWIFNFIYMPLLKQQFSSEIT